MKIQISRLIVVVCIFLFTVEALGAAGDGDEEGNYKIYVLTMGKGDELFTRFGHIALMVEDSDDSTRKVYNFGTFSFDEPGLAFKYARGFLTYWLSVGSYKNIVRRYREYNREVVVQTLALTPEQARVVARRLEINAKPENREYEYRHYLDNCCTRIRNLLDEVTAGSISKGRKEKSTGRTFRDWTDNALDGLPIYKALILFALGPAIDKPITRWDEEFLPSVLFEDLKDVVLPDGKPLVENTAKVVRREGPDPEAEIPSVDKAVIAVFGLLLFIGIVLPSIVGRRPVSSRFAGVGLTLVGLVLGLGGVVLAVFWLGTEHLDTHHNENLLLAPFLHLWLLGPGLKLIFRGELQMRTAMRIKRYLQFAFVLVAIDLLLKLGPFIQQNWGFIAFSALANVGLYVALTRTGIFKR